MKNINKIVHENNIPIKNITIGNNIAESAYSLLDNIGFAKNLAIIFDENTYEVFGNNLEAQLAERLFSAPIILPKDVLPSIEIATEINHKTEGAEALIAVGSGTINDICKYASFTSNKPYAVFCTSPSMNGYASANASMFENGIKKTFKTHLPIGIFADLEVLSTAPLRLIQSGIGDSLCRPTAQTDWLLSHYILGTEYNKKCFDIQIEAEQNMLANIENIIKRDTQAISYLMELLILSGISMYIAGGSHPASQGEHMLAHYMEMMHPYDSHYINPNNSPKKGAFHGEQIAVTTLIIAELQERILARNALQFKQSYIDKTEVIKHFGIKRAEEFIVEYHNKMIDKEKVAQINQMLTKNLLKIKTEISELYIPKNQLLELAKTSGLPTSPEDISWDADDVKTALKYTHFTRNRFTFLDV